MGMFPCYVYVYHGVLASDPHRTHSSLMKFLQRRIDAGYGGKAGGEREGEVLVQQTLHGACCVIVGKESTTMAPVGRVDVGFSY